MRETDESDAFVALGSTAWAVVCAVAGLRGRSQWRGGHHDRPRPSSAARAEETRGESDEEKTP